MNIYDAEISFPPLHRYLIGYYVKKRVLTIFVERDRLGDIEDYLRDKGYNVLSGRIDYSGVRIEDTVIVTADGFELLTSIPKQFKQLGV